MILWFCWVFLWTIDNVVRYYRGYRGVSVHVDSGTGRGNCAEIVRKIKVRMSDRRTSGRRGWGKEGDSVTGSKCTIKLAQPWDCDTGEKYCQSQVQRSDPKDSKIYFFSQKQRTFATLHPQNEFVLLTAPQFRLQALVVENVFIVARATNDSYLSQIRAF